jgi:hypothetical protein
MGFSQLDVSRDDDRAVYERRQAHAPLARWRNTAIQVCGVAEKNPAGLEGRRVDGFQLMGTSDRQ